MTQSKQASAGTAEVEHEPGMNPDSVRWVEEAARSAAAFQVQCADALERQGTTLLNLLLAGAGGAMAYAVSLGERGAALWQQGGMWASAAWLFVVAAVLLWRVLWSRPIYGPANEPENLLPAYRIPVVEAMRYELEHRQTCIVANRARNDAVGRWLNICRGLATATPLVFAAGAVLAVS